MSMSDRYWKMMINFRLGLYFYDEHVRLCVNIDRFFKLFIAIFTATSVASWQIWEKFSVPWSILVALSQVAIIINELLPYKVRMKQIQELRSVLGRVFDESENKWRDIYNGELSEDQINDLATGFLREWGDAEDKYIRDDYLSEPKWLVKRAEARMMRYFEFYYGGNDRETF